MFRKEGCKSNQIRGVKRRKGKEKILVKTSLHDSEKVLVIKKRD